MRRQLEHLQAEHPHKKVALITFNSEVVLFGDGSGQPITIAGDHLSNRAHLEAKAKEAATSQSCGPISETLASLTAKVGPPR